jgi:hypothetical protein
MSLLTSVNEASADADLFIRNISGTGINGDAVPCIKAGEVFGALRVNNPLTGLIITGGGGSVAPLVSGVCGGYSNTTGGSQVRFGASLSSFQNVVLQDNLTTINGGLTVSGAGNDIIVNDDISLGGDIIFTASGSITGYYSANTTALNCADATDTVVPNPSALTTGTYAVMASTAPGGQAQQQIATIARYTSGVGWLFGGCMSNTAGSGRFGFNVATDRSTLVISNSTGSTQNGITVNFSKLLN